MSAASGKKTKIEQLYDLYKTNPKLSNKEAGELLDLDWRCIRIYRTRLIEKGVCQFTESGGMEVIASFKNPELKVTPEYKAEVYRCLIDVYMEDFTAQQDPEKRLVIGREIRLLLEKM
ncbi:MAG: hypothetical protein IJ216_02320 [Acidaminococcaceae bacterium]|nr:hypothetical protein [Acidaminococcaceae bacterium]